MYQGQEKVVNLPKISDLLKWISRVNLVNWLRASGGHHYLGPAKNIKFNERSSEFQLAAGSLPVFTH